MKGACRLHGGDAELRESHIIPSFVIEWFKKTAPTPRIRTVAAPNLSVQDGPTLPLFCDACEQRLADWEKAVAEGVFVPLHDHGIYSFDYGPELSLFCASIALRVLLFFERHPRTDLTSRQAARTDFALSVWRDFVLGRRTNPGGFELHILPLDVLEASTYPGLPSNFNRYLARALDLDIAYATSSAFVYAKLARLCILGIIETPAQRLFRGTRVEVRPGRILPGVSQAPAAFANYLIQRAKLVAGANQSLSARQLAKNDARFRRDPEAFFQSDLYRAWVADASMFGADALPTQEGSAEKGAS